MRHARNKNRNDPVRDAVHLRREPAGQGQRRHRAGFNARKARTQAHLDVFARALPKHSIHELIATDETGKKPGDTANRIAYLAFFEVTQGGCIIVGETLLVDGEPVGQIIGFDETHEPNHINIIIGVKKRRTGPQLKIGVGSTIKFARK